MSFGVNATMEKSGRKEVKERRKEFIKRTGTERNKNIQIIVIVRLF